MKTEDIRVLFLFARGQREGRRENGGGYIQKDVSELERIAKQAPQNWKKRGKGLDFSCREKAQVSTSKHQKNVCEGGVLEWSVALG